MKHIETVIIGGGQAGLATSYYLREHKHEHIVLEQSGKAASNWRNRCWDSLVLVTPNWVFKMPGATHNDPDRNGYLPRKDVIAFFENYIVEFDLPVKYNTQVISVKADDHGGYLIQTTEDVYKARHVVIATGFFHEPKIPDYAKNITPGIHQFHCSKYRNPELVPAGAVLVVGSGQAGSQISEELNLAGRKVFLCVGTAGRVPRRYRGKDIIEWLEMTGLFDLTPEQLPPGMGKFDGIPQLSGTRGGHTLNLHQFARDGVTLLGHLRGANNTKITLAPDLQESLKKIDQFELDCTGMIDDYIEKNKLDAPAEDLPQFRDGYEQPIIEELDLKREGINTIIWAMGYRFNYSLVKLPVFDNDGFPVQSKGVTDYPGLYFAGLPWMPAERSGFLLGVAESARHIASCIVEKEKQLI
jgi:putative flavoprotein involved in K+ transport